MPNKKVDEVIKRLIVIEESFKNHLIEGGSLKNDIKWLKWFIMAVMAGMIALFFKR